MNMGRNLYGIDVPRNIDFIFDEDMHKLTIHINYPEKFMYKDDAAFEAWALFFYEKKKFDVELSFNNIAWDGDFNNILPEQSHYMRFLYRAWKFSELLPWFKIGEDNKKTVELFKNKFEKLQSAKKLCSNKPDCNAEISGSESKTEHHFENAFVSEASSILSNIVKNADNTIIKKFYNQLPVGLFEGAVLKKSRIFPTGYLDLWGISESNEFCLFELKVVDTGGKDGGLKQAGIISELFFYANFCNDIFRDLKKVEAVETTYRGYEQLLAAQEKKIEKIRAYFLAPQYHSGINTDYIKEQLNQANSSIRYEFLNYDYDEIKPIANRVRQTAKE